VCFIFTLKTKYIFYYICNYYVTRQYACHAVYIHFLCYQYFKNRQPPSPDISTVKNTKQELTTHYPVGKDFSTKTPTINGLVCYIDDISTKLCNYSLECFRPRQVGLVTYSVFSHERRREMKYYTLNDVSMSSAVAVTAFFSF